MLYKSNVLLYDRQTESLWSQLAREAVTGPLTGKKLDPLPSRLTTWRKWRRDHPETLVMSTDTGYSRNYSVDPYENYHRSPLAFLGLKRKPPHLPEKELVVGVTIKGEKKAYPFSTLRETELPVKDTVGGRVIEVHFDPSSEDAFVKGEGGERIPAMISYWFVWYDFHPETGVYGIDTGG